MITMPTTSNTWAWAQQFAGMGFSLIPCKLDKRPAIAWKGYQYRHPTNAELADWFARNGQRHQSIGVVCGTISKLLVIDLDGIEAMTMFYAQWPEMSQRTFTVLTGSGKGCHLYFRTNYVTDNINVRVPDVGGFEIRGDGCYVIAPPSPHPSGRRYSPIVRKPIDTVQSLEKVRSWMESLRTENKQTFVDASSSHKHNQRDGNDDAYKRNYLNTVFSQEINRIVRAGTGNRNNSLFYASLRLANYAAGGELSWNECQNALVSAAISIGMPRPEAQRTVNSAWNIGSKRPKTVPQATK